MTIFLISVNFIAKYVDFLYKIRYNSNIDLFELLKVL